MGMCRTDLMVMDMSYVQNTILTTEAFYTLVATIIVVNITISYLLIYGNNLSKRLGNKIYLLNLRKFRETDAADRYSLLTPLFRFSVGRDQCIHYARKNPKQPSYEVLTPPACIRFLQSVVPRNYSRHGVILWF